MKSGLKYLCVHRYMGFAKLMDSVLYVGQLFFVERLSIKFLMKYQEYMDKLRESIFDLTERNLLYY